MDQALLGALKSKADALEHDAGGDQRSSDSLESDAGGDEAGMARRECSAIERD